MKLLSPPQNQQFSVLSVLSHWKHAQHVRSKDAAAVAAFRAGRLCQSSSAGACCTPSLQLGTGCRVRCLCAGQVHKGPSGEQSHPRGIWEPPAQFCPVPSCPALPAHTELLDAGPGCDPWQNITPGTEREIESKAHTRNIQWTNPRAADLRPVQLLTLQGTKRTAPLQVKLKCTHGSALMLVHSHIKASQCWYQDINDVNHYLASFSQKVMNEFFMYFCCIKWATIK